ncbi:hypothetical protein ABZ135_12860 [Streptomyces sp. NPDC006339]|uniref:hypothetical protein n=1 Tax=Streptomyces sp. NPDC006339 TaxID=3156755 RepID=UPI0033B34C0C
MVYVMCGACARHHLLAGARRHLCSVLRGRPHEPGLDEQIVRTVVDDYTRPVGRGRRMTADLRALYPRDTEDQAVLRPLTRSRTAVPYERARLAADALRARVQTVGRTDRPAGPGRVPEQATDVDTVDQTRRMLAAAALARVLEGARERRPSSPAAPDRSLRLPRRRTHSSPAPSPHRAELQEGLRVTRDSRKEAERRLTFSPPGSRAGLARQSRIRNAAARRDGRALSHVRYSNLWLWRRCRAPRRDLKVSLALVPPLPDAHCRYVGEWIAMKLRWGLSADRVEVDALTVHAEACETTVVHYTPALSPGTSA